MIQLSTKILNHTGHRLLSQLEALTDISVQETKILYDSWNPLFFVSSLAEPIALEKAIEWKKFVKMVDLLELALLKIEEGLEKGEYSDFKAEEMQGIIKSLFSHSQNRERVLTKIHELLHD